jgi:tetratricopeptide (TPR) repeat protein
MEQGLAVLAGGAHDMPTRQQTLRGAIAWSYNLLSSEEQCVFRRLAVCVNGATGEAAGSVCTAAGALEGSVLEALEALVDKSMLQRQDDAGNVRFWLLQTLREYGLECLADAGETEATRTAHAAYYLSWVEQAVPLLSGAEQADWLDRLGREYENVRAALEWLLAGTHHTEVETERAEQALRLCIALAGFWEIRGYFSEGLAFLERALAASDEVSAAIRAQALYDAGFLALILDDNERAGGFLRASQMLFRESGDKASMANILRMQGNLARAKNSYKLARRLLEEALALYREQGDRRKMASTRADLAQIALVQSDFSRARKLLEENLTRYKALHEQYYTAHSLYLLACTHFLSRDDRAQAQALAEESLALFKEVGNRRLIAHVLSLLGQIALTAHEDAKARSLLEESQATFKTVEDRFGAAETHIALARLAASQGDEEAARALYETSWELLSTSGAKELNAACLEGFGEVLLSEGAAEHAVRLWAIAASVRAAIVAPMPPVYRASYVQSVATARQWLGEEAFQSAWAQGREMPLEQVQL